MPSPGVLRATGELDRSNAPVLRQALRLAARTVPPGGTIELDCSGVAFLDASGAQTLAHAARDLAPSRGLVIVDPGPIADRLLRTIARTTPSLAVVSARETALPRAS